VISEQRLEDDEHEEDLAHEVMPEYDPTEVIHQPLFCKTSMMRRTHSPPTFDCGGTYEPTPENFNA
jgi:hypothetical protein